MNTQQYLWWIETIRQDTFRRRLPSNIVGWGAFTIGLITLFIFILADLSADIKVRAVSFFVFLISFFIAIVSSVVGEILSKESEKKINQVKNVWESQIDGNKDFNEKLKWFYSA